MSSNSFLTTGVAAAATGFTAEAGVGVAAFGVGGVPVAFFVTIIVVSFDSHVHPLMNAYPLESCLAL